MPVTKYYVFVGGVLAALLLIVGWYCPAPPPIFADRPEIVATAAIRIRSERKWSEKVEFDTTQPTMTPPADEVSPFVAPLPALAPEETTSKPRLETLAQLNPDRGLNPTRHQSLQSKRRLARTSRSNCVAKGPPAERLARLDAHEPCCQFGLANTWQEGPLAVSRKRGTVLWSMGQLAFSQR